MLDDILRENNYTSIPLRATNFGHLELKATINGFEALFLVDTGAASTVIDLAFVEDKQLPVMETTIKGGGVGTSDLVIYQLEAVDIYLEHFFLSGVTIYAADLRHVKESLLEKGETSIPSGVIGADILFNQKAIIDYPNLVLYMQQVT